MWRMAIACFVVVGSAAAASLAAKPASYELPAETAAFAPGPHLDVVERNCGVCHSADYIAVQPRTLKDKKGFWQGEVSKMTKAYRASITDEDAQKIVDYLAATY